MNRKKPTNIELNIRFNSLFDRDIDPKLPVIDALIQISIFEFRFSFVFFQFDLDFQHLSRVGLKSRVGACIVGIFVRIQLANRSTPARITQHGKSESGTHIIT